MRKAPNTKSKRPLKRKSRRLTPKQMREFKAAPADPDKGGYPSLKSLPKKYSIETGHWHSVPILSEKQARELQEAREAGRREEGEYPGLKEFFRKHGLM